MRIIQRGQIPEEKLRRLTCTHCSTVFEFSMKEATSWGDQRESGYCIACPLPLCCRPVYFE